MFVDDSSGLDHSPIRHQSVEGRGKKWTISDQVFEITHKKGIGSLMDFAHFWSKSGDLQGFIELLAVVYNDLP